MKRPNYYKDFISKFPNKPKYEQYQMYVSELEKYIDFIENKLSERQSTTEVSDKPDNKALHVTDVRLSTPISDKTNLSINSSGIKDLDTWIYKLGVIIDKKIQLKGFTNTQRIEIALREYCT